MRFSLQDIQKRVQRRGGELTVTLHFLRNGASHDEIARLIAFHEQMLGQPQRNFNIDEARTIVGDYRLAHCLLATLSAWYSWRSPRWDEVTQRMSSGRDSGTGTTGTIALAEAGITSSVSLRLVLFDYVNAHHGGFLTAQDRAQVFEQFASPYGLNTSDLEYLLALDSEEEAVLTREASSRSPTPEEVAALYNQWVFEAAMFNASEAHFTIDCNAFLEAQYGGREPGVMKPGRWPASPLPSPHQGGQRDEGRGDAGHRPGFMTPVTPSTGVGAVIKRLCYLARKLGMYYDLEYAANDVSKSSMPYLHLTLYGPQDMTGTPQQYGVRLARLCRLLLGYSSPGYRQASKLPGAAIVQAGAVVHFLQRAYRFEMDAQLLALLPANETKVSSTDGSDIYDSGIEQAFAEAFSSLARSYAAEGWQLEREPEPLLFSYEGAAAQAIFIPDFALTRDRHRIYLEILGFWTPSYRERKVQKLQQLKGRRDIMLALPIEARGAFASLAGDFPLVEYDGQLSATEVLQMLRAHIDDFAERMAGIDREQVRRRIHEDGWLPDRASFEALHCYRRSELIQAAESIIDDTIAFLPGVGFYDRGWLGEVGASIVEWLEEPGQDDIGTAGAASDGDRNGKAPLAEALQMARTRWTGLAGNEDTALEALLGLMTGVRIRRSSIFEAVIEPTSVPEEPPEEAGTPEQIATPKKVVRERRAAYKKRPAGKSDTIANQQDLWG